MNLIVLFFVYARGTLYMQGNGCHKNKKIQVDQNISTDFSHAT